MTAERSFRVRSEPSGKKSNAEASNRSPCDGFNCHDSEAWRECLGMETFLGEVLRAGVGAGGGLLLKESSAWRKKGRERARQKDAVRVWHLREEGGASMAFKSKKLLMARWRDWWRVGMYENRLGHRML